MAPEGDVERLAKGVGDVLLRVLDPRGRADTDVALEPAVKAVLTRVIEEVRADPEFARKSPAEILDYCATVLQRVRRYVVEAREAGSSEEPPQGVLDP